MNHLWELGRQIAAKPWLAGGVRAAIVIVLALVLARVLSRAAGGLAGRHRGPHYEMLVRRAAFYGVVGLGAVSALSELGFSLHAFLGAAGVLTVAFGFAAQTSASNLVAGLFLIAERPFVVGDVIKIGDTTGEVVTVDLLSTKLRTFDNLFVRVPNDSVVKAQITNMSHYPIRRLDVKLSVAYASDLELARKTLLEVADKNPGCLRDPVPLFIFLGFGESGLDLQFSVWSARDRFLELRNSVHEAIKVAFERAGIEIPFPHRSLQMASRSAPLRVVVAPTAPASRATSSRGSDER